MNTAFLTGFPRPLLFAHRGASGDAPENTLDAFLLAQKLGAPGIELDVHLCATGELVVIHDNTPGRTGRLPSGEPLPKDRADVPIEQMSLEELRSYDFGVFFGKEFAGEKIATLEEVLDACKGLSFDIEIKTESLRCRNVARETARFLNSRPEKGNFIVSSFNPLALFHFRHYSDIPIALIYSDEPGEPWFLKKGQGRLLCRPDIMKPSCADTAKAHFGKSVHGRPWITWTVNTPENAKDALSRGAQGVISNFPGEILKGL
ncbi:MAG: glycerophosphodiester phosphodiesterase [Spirochaetaceae bacterium]|jgi:glycerophosphoryl diester phosphodiesterase|nr:glycerophosphodiester phosphodiesterase [Spirochaetaceae bacterium]